MPWSWCLLTAVTETKVSNSHLSCLLLKTTNMLSNAGNLTAVDAPCNLSHVVFITVWLTYFSPHNVSRVYWHQHKMKDSLLFEGQKVFHGRYFKSYVFEGVTRAHPSLRSYRQMIVSGGERKTFSSVVWPLLSCPCCCTFLLSEPFLSAPQLNE